MPKFGYSTFICCKYMRWLQRWRQSCCLFAHFGNVIKGRLNADLYLWSQQHFEQQRQQQIEQQQRGSHWQGTARSSAPIAHINMQLFCICRKCETPRPLAPCDPIWALLLFFFIYTYIQYLLDDLTRCWRCLWHLRLLGDSSKLTAERECRSGKGEKGKLDAMQGKRRVSGNIMSVAGIGPHIVLCDIFICWFACNLFIFMRIICIWQIFMRPHKASPSLALPRCCSISNKPKERMKKQRIEAWITKKKGMYNVLPVQNRNR